LPDITYLRWGWDIKSKDASFYQKNYATIATSCTNLGAMFAALGAARFTKYGKWKCIIATNIFVMLATAFCLINNSYVICFGRFLYGMAAGAFTVFVPKYVTEMTPLEYRGPFGAIPQFMCTFGIFSVALLGLPIPNYENFNTLDDQGFLV